MRRNEKGFSVVESLLVLVIVGLIGFVGWYVWNSKNNTDQNLSNALQSSQSKTPKPTVANYYDCWDVLGKTDSDTTSDCTYNGKTYKLPTEFTTDMIRGYEKLPDSSKPKVTEIATSTFKCGEDLHGLPTEVKVMKVVQQKYLMLGVACDSGRTEVLVESDGAWASVMKTQGSFDCATVDKYKIPKGLFVSQTNKGVCADSSGQEKTIPY